MSEDMIERAASAAYEKWRELWVDPAPPWKEITRGSQALWITSQRAAIAAMREPTEAMELAGRGYLRSCGIEGWTYAGDAYEAMIAAALKTPAKPA